MALPGILPFGEPGMVWDYLSIIAGLMRLDQKYPFLKVSPA
jgi:hypothetical protein